MRLGYFLKIGICALTFGAAPVIAQEAAPSLAALEQAAQDGGTTAQYDLGLRYHEGAGVVQNYATAADWFAKAALAGHAPAQNYLGRYFFEGLGVEQNYAQALALLEQAALSNEPQFVFDLALALEQSDETLPRAAGLYRKAAELGHIDASVNLAVLLQDGRGVAQDFAQARLLYEPAAQAGHSRALNNLGLLYVRGNGVPQDYRHAAELFSAAAEKGLRRAMRNLGVLYENGFGVPLDEAIAAELYRQAGGGSASTETATPSSQYVYDPRLQPLEISETTLAALRHTAQAGDPVAQFQLGWLLVSADAPDFESHRQAAALFKSAAEHGYGPAMINLGVLYFEGLGVPQDYVLGHMWMALADNAGQDQAKAALTQFSSRLTASQTNDAQARAAAIAGH